MDTLLSNLWSDDKDEELDATDIKNSDEDGSLDDNHNSDDSSVENDEELEENDLDDDLGDDDDDGAVEIFGRTLTRDEFETMESQQMMDADYRKKTMEISDERKRIASLGDDLEATIAEVESFLLGEINSEELQQLEQEDYAEYLREKAKIEKKIAKLDEAKKRTNTVSSETIEAETTKLMDMMKEWSDPKKGLSVQKEDLKAAVEYGKSIGYDAEDFNTLVEHRHLRALIDAGKYQKLKNSKAEVLKRKRSATKKTPAKKASDSNPLSFAELLYGANN